MKSIVVYHPVYQKFTEYDEAGNITKEGSFKIQERQEVILESDHATIVFLDNGSAKGVSLCHPNDSFDVTIGRKLAYLRAKIVSLSNEIKKVLKETHKHQ